MKKLDCICFGSIIIDYRKKLTRGKDIMSKPLRLTDKLVNFSVGGISILAIILKRMGFNTAVVGKVGRDIAGYGIKTYLEEKYKINTGGIRFTNHPTSYSMINISDKERYIQHNIGANTFLKADKEVMSFINESRPKVVAIGYSGLLPKMDCENGAKMAEFIDILKSEGIKTALDTHTVEKEYSMLIKPLRGADIFFCNSEEGKHVSGENNPADMLDYITKSYLEINDIRYRLFGVTLPNGVYVAYGKKEIFNKGFVKSPWYSDKPKDLTGAGDALRAGFYAYLIRNLESFEKGTFDWHKAAMLGNLTAAVMINEGFSGIKSYIEMLNRSSLP